MGNIAPLHQPLGEGYALRPSELTNEGLLLVHDPSDNDPDLKRCRSMKPGPQGCKGYRVADSDYCQGHKTMIEKEQAEREAWIAAGCPETE